MDLIDSRLRNVWADAREFCALVNLASITGRKIRPRLFQEIMVTLQYRLLHYEVGSTGLHVSISHAIQIGILVFTTTIFLHVAGIPTRYYWLTSQIRKMLKAWEIPTDTQGRKLRLWLLCISSISGLYDGTGEWLSPATSHALAELDLKEWRDVKVILKEYLWIDVLHDPLAENVMKKCWSRIPDS